MECKSITVLLSLWRDLPLKTSESDFLDVTKKCLLLKIYYVNRLVKCVHIRSPLTISNLLSRHSQDVLKKHCFRKSFLYLHKRDIYWVKESYFNIRRINQYFKEGVLDINPYLHFKYCFALGLTLSTLTATRI